MDQYDAYVRLRPRDRARLRASAPAINPGSLLFVDIEGLTLEVADLRDAFREVLHRLATTQYVIVRWPRITAAASDEEEAALQASVQSLVDEIGDATAGLGLSRIWVGIVRFKVGSEPEMSWVAEAAPNDAEEDELLKRALDVELRTMLDWGHAVWTPAGYHFELPSGQHTGTFVRVADALRSPRDARVLTSWLSPRMRDGLSIVADSASLIPLIVDLQAVMRKRNWRPGATEILDEYPRTRLDVLRVVRRVREADGGVLGLLSVSGSGRLRDLMLDALSTTAVAPAQWSLVVLVEKDGTHADGVYQAVAHGMLEERVSTWLGLRYEVEDPAVARGRGCRLCQSNERAQVVKIDPRSFETLTFPGVLPITPDVTSARQSLHLWQACDRAEAVGVEVKPATKASFIARGKGSSLAARIDFDELMKEDRVPHLAEALAARLSQLNRTDRDGRRRKDDLPIKYKDIDGILVSRDDWSPELEKTILPMLRGGLGLKGAAVAYTDPAGEAPPEVATWRRALTFSLGSLSGWNMRQLQLQVERAWQGKRGHRLLGLVLHARPPSEREWVSLGRSYRDELRAIWLTYLPLRSPLREEGDHILELPPDPKSDLPPEALRFRQERLAYCFPRRNRSWQTRLEEFASGRTPYNPRAVLWGSPPRGGAASVRTESNFGFEVRSLAAYVAIGAAMHRARQSASADDPRQRVFEMPAIARSYYDGILVASILRWCEPQEAWWGDSPRAAEQSVADLIARTRDPVDQKILFPELLLAASMGKMPSATRDLLTKEMPRAADSWCALDRAPLEFGLDLYYASTGRRSAPDR